MKSGNEVSAQSLADADLQEVLFLDVRTPGEFQGIQIPGSLNAPLGDLTRRAEELRVACASKPVVLVCRSGQRASKACSLLSSEGIEDLRILEGGILAWEQAGLAVERGRPGMSLERQVRIAAGLMVLAGVLLGFGLHPGFFGLSGFVGAGLVFAGLTDTCAMGMLLARMPWNRRTPPIGGDA